MKSWFRPLFFLPSLVLIFTAGPLAPARAQPAPAPVEPAANPPEKASPAAPAAPAPEAPPPAAAAPEEPPLRRLDEPNPSPAATLRSLEEDIRRRADETRQRARERIEENRARMRARQANHTGNNVVNVFNDSTLTADERADNVVAVFGSSTSAGTVLESVVSVFGQSRVSGPVGEKAVTVFGNSTVTGRVDQEVVVVFGNASIDSHVGRVVTVFGNVKLGPRAEVDEEVICVMGEVERDPAAIVHRQVRNFGRSFGFGAGIGVWIETCFLKARPLAFQHGVEWAWIVACSFLAFYLLLALLFRGGFEKCLTTLETRSGAVALTALGTIMLKPIVIVLLCITMVGVFAVPFLTAGLFFAGLFGTAVMLAWFGRRLLAVVGAGGLHPFLATLVGGVLVLALYTVPVLGLMTYLILGWLGVGVVLCTIFTGRKRQPAVSRPFSGTTAATAAFASAGIPLGAETGSLPPPVMSPPPVIAAVTLPRAGFWIRFGALWIDLVLLSFLAAFATQHGSLAPFGIAAYAALMWRLKGTTIGGVVCNLKVVRLDGREIDWTTAIVRALACFLSLAIFGLGFIWVAIDDDRQSWHDKIAGTTVVRVPKGVSLL